MAWITTVAKYWKAKEGLRRLRESPPERNVLYRTELLIWACEDGADEWMVFASQCLDMNIWDPVSPTTIARNPNYDPPMALAGACIDLLAGDTRALPYLTRFAHALSKSRKSEVQTTGRMAQALCSLQWPGTKPWTEYPDSERRYLSGLMKSRLADAINVSHCPHALYGLTRSFVLGLVIVHAGSHSREAFFKAGRDVLGPHRKGRTLVYRRASRPPLRQDVFAGRAAHGCDAIEVCGPDTRLYYDMFTNYVTSPLPVPLDLEEEPELLDAILGDPRETLDAARPHVPAALWKRMTSSIVHVVAIDPAITIVTDDIRRAAEQRLGAPIEIVPFLAA